MKLARNAIKRYRNADYPGLEAVLTQYLEDVGGAAPTATCIAVAGPGPRRLGIGRAQSLGVAKGIAIAECRKKKARKCVVKAAVCSPWNPAKSVAGR